ncbi:hypothetical protein KBD69_01195 [Candidatus Woesebacteria bacterium]|nr:hypothetical protein [Candidatus Woesebacteria bacterium]
MKKTNYLLVLFLLFVGFCIFIFSLYNASLVGLKRQLGLVGGDLTQSVDVNRLYRAVLEVGGVPSCEYWRSVAPIPRYIFAEDNEKMELGRDLSNQRINCSIDYLLSGNTERGVYSMLKAVRYELAGAQIMERTIKSNPSLCGKLQTNASYGLIEAYLESVEGNARGIIEREYEELQRVNRQNLETCGL